MYTVPALPLQPCKMPVLLETAVLRCLQQYRHESVTVFGLQVARWPRLHGWEGLCPSFKCWGQI
jgi:hypothetical protein